jgi:hypothetical protein
VKLILILILSLGACQKSEAPKKKRAPKPAAAESAAAQEAKPTPAPAQTADDPSWLAGTWQKKGASEWLLFNPPNQVAVLAGKPARMIARGKFSARGRFLMLEFPLPNGGVTVRELTAAPDRSRLSEGTAAAWYERGSPPP